MNDAYKKILEQINDPFRGLNLMQDSLSKIKIAESLALRPHEQMLKTLVDRENSRMQLIQPYFDTQEMLKRTLSSIQSNELNSVRKVMESIKAGYVGNFGIDNSASLSIQKMIQESSALNGSIAASLKQLEPFGGDFRRALNLANDFYSKRVEAAANIEVHSSLKVDGEIITAEKFSDAVQELTEITSTHEGLFDQLVEKIKKYSPHLLPLFFHIALSYFVSIIANMHTGWWEQKWTEAFSNDAPGVKKSIRTDARECFFAGALDNCRFVTAKKLVVRSSANSRSKTLYSIKFGVVVKLLSKDKDWSLIEYRDDDLNTIEQGWVFSRHLAKFE